MESIVSFVVGKLADLIATEAKLLGGVRDQVKQVETDLTYIKRYLRDADSKRRKGDESAENWLNQLRDVTYRIEDAIDTFYLQLDEGRHQKEGSFGKLKMLGHKLKNVPLQQKLGTELGDIQKELGEIFKSKDKYEIKPLQDGDEFKGELRVLPKRRAAYQDVDETEVVGLAADKNNILKLLRREETARRTVTTIVGPGGIGKTTLARMVYNSAKVYFEYHIMLSVSQQFSIADLLRKMLSKTTFSVPKNQDVGYYVDELKKTLPNWSGYLIILDDVWGVELWDELQHALPDCKDGSRVLITSRFTDVAKSADPRIPPYKLDFLNAKESRELLLKKAFLYQESGQECSNDFFELANALSEKCKGLPLALIVLGGILSTRGQNYHDWKKVLDTMDWHDEGKDCMDVLAMSYEDMSFYLKTCFLYLASFPEDYEISARRLIRMWVAEGFLPQKMKKTMEETAEVCLEELSQRSMIQVSNRYPNGSLKYCRVHDILRDLAMHEARKEKFLTVFPKPIGVDKSGSTTRRASLLSECSKFIEHVDSSTRSLFWFGQRSDLPMYSVFRLLRVLEIVGVDKIELSGIDRLIHLRYLGFRNGSGLELPNDRSLGRLKNLETLDLRGTTIVRHDPVQLMGLWTIGTLRHVMSGPYSGPPPNSDFSNLQTLQWVSVLKTWQKNELPRLNNLIKLGLDNGYSNYEKEEINWDVVVHLLRTLPSLLFLGIRGHGISKEIVYPKVIPDYQNLQTLHLKGRWSVNVALEASSFPPHLLKLTLIDSSLAEDPMPELGKLKSLKKLRLEKTVYKGREEMSCPAGFPLLQSLRLYLPDIKSFTVMEGVMPNLKHLTRMGDTKLNLPSQLKQFTPLN
ncbi:Disease resistance family protein [Rhynchospora pubera]|uniref:Disease resistance family protein n=1 Tax=Rhynchospora pubera TaxID=906938 RepID=A0AAV8EDS5_9POAL|nr:Disease resistance family protein [Rhynchospora pubera]